MEWHVGHCAECRKAVSAVSRSERGFPGLLRSDDDGTKPRRKCLRGAWAAWLRPRPSWQSFLLAQPRDGKAFSPCPVPAARAGDGFESVRQRQWPAVRSPRGSGPAPVHSSWIAEEPTVEVALPADALFPPGAVPQGFSFIADVRPSAVISSEGELQIIYATYIDSSFAGIVRCCLSRSRRPIMSSLPPGSVGGAFQRMSAAPVQGAPYSATITNESVQTLGGR